MLIDIRNTPADIGPDAPARADRMMRSARAVRTHRRATFLLSGAVLTKGGGEFERDDAVGWVE